MSTTTKIPVKKTNGNAAVSENAAFDVTAMKAEPSLRKPSVMADFDLKTLKADGPKVAVAPELPDVVVKRPNRLETIFVHPDPEWRIEIWIIPSLGKRDDPTYAVMPDVASKYPSICRRALLVPYADHEGQLFIWVILLEDRTGSINSYSRSALSRLEQGAGKWARYEADLAKQRYRLIVAEEQPDPPEWPKEGLSYMVRTAFEDRVIADPDHEVLRRLRGKEV